jgi:signal transduction histidine kinase
LRGEDLIIRNLLREAGLGPEDFLRDHRVISGICAGVQGKDKRILGILGAFTGKPREFVDDELRFVEGLANVLGAALVREKNQAEIQRHQSQIQHLQRLESVGQLAAGLAHDYNNILTLIHGHVTLALESADLPTHAAGSLKTVLEAVERAAGLTRQMLSFSRKQAMSPQPVDVNAAVSSIGKLLDRVLGSRIRLQLERRHAGWRHPDDRDFVTMRGSNFQQVSSRTAARRLSPRQRQRHWLWDG